MTVCTPLRGNSHIAPHLLVKCKKKHLWGIAFSSQRCKIFKLSYTQHYLLQRCSDSYENYRVIYTCNDASAFCMSSEIVSHKWKMADGRYLETRSSAIAEGLHDALVSRKPAITKHPIWKWLQSTNDLEVYKPKVIVIAPFT